MATGRCLIQADESGNSDSPIAFVNYLISQCPQSRIALLWDGASYHRSGEVKDHLAALNDGLELSQWKVTCLRFAPNDWCCCRSGAGHPALADSMGLRSRICGKHDLSL